MSPIVAQLTQGVTPEKIALTIALGVTISVFPVLGATTTLCALVGIGLRLNQPVIQLVNYAAYPLQLMLLVPFYRAGERLLGRVPVPLSITIFAERIRADLFQFLKDFGTIALGGVFVWLLAAPLAVAMIYYIVRQPLRVLAKRSEVE